MVGEEVVISDSLVTHLVLSGDGITRSSLFLYSEFLSYISIDLHEEAMKVGCLGQVLHLQERKLLQHKVCFVGYLGTPHLLMLAAGS